MFLSIGMLKLNYFLADIFILSAEKQPIKLSWRKIEWLLKTNRHYKIFCVNGNTGFRNESRIFYFIHLQNEEAYERKESSSA